MELAEDVNGLTEWTRQSKLRGSDCEGRIYSWLSSLIGPGRILYGTHTFPKCKNVIYGSNAAECEQIARDVLDLPTALQERPHRYAIYPI